MWKPPPTHRHWVAKRTPRCWRPSWRRSRCSADGSARRSQLTEPEDLRRQRTVRGAAGQGGGEPVLPAAHAGAEALPRAARPAPATASSARRRATSCSPRSRPRTGCAPSCSRTTPDSRLRRARGPRAARRRSPTSCSAATRGPPSARCCPGRARSAGCTPTTAGREADFDALRAQARPRPTVKDPLAVDGATALAELPALLEAELRRADRRPRRRARADAAGRCWRPGGTARSARRTRARTTT